MQKVLAVHKDEETGEDGDPWLYATVRRGERFHEYKPSGIESAFVEQFMADDVHVAIHLYQRSINQWYQGGNLLRKEQLSAMVTAGLLTQNLLQRLFGLFSLSPKGAELKRQIEDLLQRYNTFVEQKEHAREEWQKVISALGTVILLAEHHDPDWLQKVFTERHDPDFDRYLTLGDVGYWFIWDATDYHHADWGFTDGFGHETVSGGSSCSTGCSGCGGGCSGCGGCGGCS